MSAVLSGSVDAGGVNNVEFEYGLRPGADVVFLSTDSVGTPGTLNRQILAALNLPESLIPDAEALAPGYAFVSAAPSQLCFVVTVGSAPTRELLSKNLSRALTDSRLSSARSFWLPLMGTGAGRLDHEESRSLILEALGSTEWLNRPEVQIRLAAPEHYVFQSSRTADQEGMVDPPATLEIRSSGGQGSESLGDEGEDGDDAPGGVEGTPDAPLIPLSEAVTAALRYAVHLKTGRRGRGGALSTTLLFFALSESQLDVAPDALSSDRSAALFAGAVHTLARRRFDTAWASYFNPGFVVGPMDDKVATLVQTSNVRQVISLAAKAAAAAGRTEVGIDDLVVAILGFSRGRHTQALEQMGVRMTELLSTYRDAIVGQIGTTLLNDMANAVDHLGYASYAEAITDFIVNSATPPPLSVSIQAPWGAGKSSLMHQIRERLDPIAVREANRFRPSTRTHLHKLREQVRFVIKAWNVAARVEPKSIAVMWSAYRRFWVDNTPPKPLRLRDTLKFLNRDWKVKEEITATPRQLWTIWFNAWKYDSSEQVWAGLVDAIVIQISGRLPLIERERFLLRLQLARIDDGVVRKKIYDRILTNWFNSVRGWAAIGGTIVAGLFGLHHVAENPRVHLDSAIAKLLADPRAQATLAHAPYASLAFLGMYMIVSYLHSSNKTKAEPASFSLAEYLKVPDYNLQLGTIHHIHEDLLKVLAATPRNAEGKNSPLVIFIDDLDRCSPSKIASVVEGVSMFLGMDDYRCMFVIGIDPQMIAAALEDAHSKVRDHLPRYERTVPLGWRFMDKFIQLPFTIPPSSEAVIKTFVTSISGDPIARPAPVVTPMATPSSATPSSVTAPPTSRSQTRAERETRARALGASVTTSSVTGQKTESTKMAVAAFKESHDVGYIIQEAAEHTSGNPREIKRLANLARLYLGLRNVRRSRDPQWRYPTLSQYARWIVVTLRWPDMMRWLQWGADEATWSESELAFDLSRRRLLKLETQALETADSGGWTTGLVKSLRVPGEEESDWAADPKLFEFFQAEAKLPHHERLSTALGRGFW